MNPPSDLVLFFGRLHPLLVHLPIGLIVLLATLEAIARLTRYRQANSNAGWVLALAVPTSICTAVCGLLLSLAGGYEDSLLQWHKWTGIATAAACLVTGICYALNRAKAYRVCLFGSFAALVVASHFGGSLTHGSDYLTRYAPGPLRGLLGGSASSASQQAAKPPAGEQTAFTAVVKPVLDEYCVSCHGPQKSKGGLRVDTFEGLMKGGKDMVVVSAGKPDESEIIKRLMLPLESEDHMPPEGKPQPSEDDAALLRWWIEAGAPRDRRPNELKQNPRIAAILARKLGSTTASIPVAAPSGAQPKPRDEATALAGALTTELGVPVTALSEQEAWLQANASVAGKNFGDDALAKLSPIAPNLRWLDLAGTAITDAGLTNLAAMANLTRLHLERTKITDEGLAALASLRQLEYLNLYGTEISEAGLEHLNELPRLKQLYLWQTKVTPEAAKAFADARTDKDQLKAWEDEIEALKAKIRDAHISVELGVSLAAAKPTAGKPINTECPVSGKPINPEKTTVYEGKVIAFCCDDCKASFEKDPKAYVGKLEALLKASPEQKQAAVNTVCPVSGKPVNPEKTTTYEGKVIAFCCDDCKAEFLKDPKQFLSKLQVTAEAGKGK